MTLIVKRLLLFGFEGRDRFLVLVKELIVVAEAESLVTDLKFGAAGEKIFAEAEQFTGADGIEADLVEEAEEPGFVIGEIGGLAGGVPHPAGAADELVYAGAFHAVDAGGCTAGCHGGFGGPGGGPVVFGGGPGMGGGGRGGEGGRK